MATRTDKTFWKRVHRIVHAPLTEARMIVNVNGKNWQVGEQLTYDEILKMADEREGASVICNPKDKRLAGFSVIKGQTVEVTDGMVINCIMTGNA